MGPWTAIQRGMIMSHMFLLGQQDSCDPDGNQSCISWIMRINKIYEMTCDLRDFLLSNHQNGCIEYYYV